MSSLFFFQAEDGIRDWSVTGVQTCALPILSGFVPGRINRVSEVLRMPGGKAAHVAMALKGLGATPTWIGFAGGATGSELLRGLHLLEIATMSVSTRSEEHTSELQSLTNLVCRLLLEKKK